MVLQFQNTKRFAVIITFRSQFSVKKSVCGDATLKNGRYPVVLQVQAKCFVLQRISVYYISLQFNSGLFQLILNYVINHFGQ